MPIGKSAINRITNNGYSNTKTTAPDMENSTVLTNPSPEVIEKMIPSAKKTAAPKAEKKIASETVKNTSEKSEETFAPKTKKTTSASKKAKPSSEENTTKTDEITEEKNGFVYINVGKDLPTYLL